MTISASVLTPVSSISTYGKIISSTSKGRVSKGDEGRELILDFAEDGHGSKAAKSDLEGTKEPPLRSEYSSFKVYNPKRQSVAFLNKGKQCDRMSAKCGADAYSTPPPSHYNPRIHLTKHSSPSYSVPRPHTAMSRKPDRGDDEHVSDEGWASKLHSALSGKRPQSALSMTPTRTDRLASRVSPWLKNIQSGTTSAFRSPARKALYEGMTSELPDETPDISVVKPRSGATINIDQTIDREQRAKVANEGAPFGTYTLQLDYNKSLNNDIPTRAGLKKVDGQVMPANSTIRMEHQTDRPALNAGGNFETTPGLEKLGLSQAVWGTEDGWAGGTEQVLTTKRTNFTKMNHISWKQCKKTGSQRDLHLMDVMYDANIDVVKRRTQSMVNLKQQTQRVPISAAATEGADVDYNWTRWRDKKHLASPNLEKEPDRAQRMKAGFGSYADPKQDVMYDEKKIQKAISTRVKGVDIESITSRDPPSIVPPDKYKDQLSSGKTHLKIGELQRSAVFGSPTRVPDMGGKSKRWPKPSGRTGKGFHL